MPGVGNATVNSDLKYESTKKSDYNVISVLVCLLLAFGGFMFLPSIR